MPTLTINFEGYLVKTSEVSDKTLRNYRADLANFLNWSKSFLALRRIPLDDSGETLIKNISPFLIKEYLRSLTLAKTPPATINRRLSTLRAFGKFLTKSGHLKDNPFTSFQNVANPKKSVISSQLSVVGSMSPVVSRSVSDQPKTDNRKLVYALGVAATILLVVSITQTYFLLKKPVAQKTQSPTVVLGASSFKPKPYPLPAPSITFGDLLSK